jgi:vitamin B12 transporter
MAFASFEGWDGYKVLDDQVLRDADNPDKNTNIGYDRSTIGAKYRKEFKLAGKSVLSAQLRKQQGYFDYPYGHYKLGHTFNDWEEEIGILKWDHDLNDSFSYYVKSHFHFWSADCTFMNIDGSYRYNAAPWAYKDYGLNFLTSTRWGGGEILSGIDYQNYWGKDEVVRIYDTETTEIYGLFANYRPYLPFSPDSKLAIGARYNITNEGVDSTIWDVSLKTPLIESIYFRSTVGTSFSVPTALQLYGKDPSRGRYGNPDLDPETSLNTEIGIGGGWQYFTIDAGYFSHDIEDMIKRITLANGDSTYKNQGGTTKIKGVEISTGIGPFQGVTFNLSATWVDAKNGGEQLERIPEYYGSANVSYRNTSGWFGANLGARYTGDVYERGLGTFKDVNYGDVFVVDASTFVRLGTNNHHKISLRIENIFDEKYASRYNKAKNSDGDYFLYHQNGLPLTVVLGYTFTF